MSTAEFKFEIGDIVRLKISENQKQLTNGFLGEKHHELRGTVLSRWLEECVGGVQLHYDVRWVLANGQLAHERPVRHHGFELVKSEPFPVQEKAAIEKAFEAKEKSKE